MKSGTFNHVNRIGNIIIKTSKNDDVSEQLLKEIHTDDVFRYVKDINEVGIETGKLYGYHNIFNYNILIQEFIKGMTIQACLDDNSIDNKTKLKIFKEFLELYKKSKNNDNLCLDWNMQNFIKSTDDIYYIDFIPCLYKTKIMTITKDNLLPYKESYLDNNIQVSGILGYAIMSIIKNSTIEESINMYEQMQKLFDININKDSNHVYIYKLKQIEEYLKNNISYEELKNNINAHSMTKILRNIR